MQLIQKICQNSKEKRDHEQGTLSVGMEGKLFRSLSEG